MITRADSQRIWEEVKANHARLDACEGPHDFKPHPRPGRPALPDHKCTKCGGVIDIIALSWYTRGLAHGKLNATH